MASIILLVFAFVLAIVAALGWTPRPWFNFGWLAFACFVASELVGHGSALGGLH